MRIDEIVRSCANHSVAEAAVASIGGSLTVEVGDRAAAYDMSVGAFTAMSVARFLRHGDEGELRSVVAAMEGAQEPVLTGLHRILCIMLVSGAVGCERSVRDRVPRMTAQLCAMHAELRHELRA